MSLQSQQHQNNSIPVCQAVKNNGNPCRQRGHDKVMSNGRCRYHQHDKFAAATDDSETETCPPPTQAPIGGTRSDCHQSGETVNVNNVVNPAPSSDYSEYSSSVSADSECETDQGDNSDCQHSVCLLRNLENKNRTLNERNSELSRQGQHYLEVIEQKTAELESESETRIDLEHELRSYRRSNIITSILWSLLYLVVFVLMADFSGCCSLLNPGPVNVVEKMIGSPGVVNINQTPIEDYSCR